MEKIIDGHKIYYPDNIEFYKGWPIREVTWFLSNETNEIVVWVITEQQLEFGVNRIKHILTGKEYIDSGIEFFNVKIPELKRCKHCGAPIN